MTWCAEQLALALMLLLLEHAHVSVTITATSMHKAVLREIRPLHICSQAWTSITVTLCLISMCAPEAWTA